MHCTIVEDVNGQIMIKHYDQNLGYHIKQARDVWPILDNNDQLSPKATVNHVKI